MECFFLLSMLVANHEGIKLEDEEEMSVWNELGDGKFGMEGGIRDFRGKKLGKIREKWEKMTKKKGGLEDQP